MKCFIKTQSGMSAYDTAIRDLDEEEMCDFVAKSSETTSSGAVTLRAFQTETGDAVCVAALTTCSKKLPISYRLKGDDGKEYAFRGNVAVCGCKEMKPRGLPNAVMDELKKHYPVEPIYKDDAVCIPSVTEWCMLPPDLRNCISPNYWTWTRNESELDPGEIDTVISGSDRGPYSSRYPTDTAGGVTPFIDLRKIDEGTAAKMREFMGRSHDVTLEAKGYSDLHLVKVSDDVYAGVSSAWEMDDDQSGLMQFDEDGRTSYEDSTLREYLNGEYLTILKEFIEKAEISS